MIFHFDKVPDCSDLIGKVNLSTSLAQVRTTSAASTTVTSRGAAAGAERNMVCVPSTPRRRVWQVSTACSSARTPPCGAPPCSTTPSTRQAACPSHSCFTTWADSSTTPTRDGTTASEPNEDRRTRHFQVPHPDSQKYNVSQNYHCFIHVNNKICLLLRLFQ